MNWIKFLERYNRRVLDAPDEGAGGGTGEGTGAGTGEGSGEGSGEGTGAGGAKWFEADTISAEDREWIVAKGLATNDPLEALPMALKGYREGEKKLGKPADSLISRPGKDQQLSEWMKSNAEIFGLPENAEGYKLDRPDLPEGMEWDAKLEEGVRQVAFEEGIPASALNKLVAAYGAHMGEIFQSAGDDLTGAKEAMMAELQKDWGEQTPAKLTQARQAMSAVADAAGLDAAAQTNLVAALSEKGGDATVMRLFAAIGGMMSEDMLAGLSGGPTTIGTTPAEAKQKLAQMRSPEGEYGKAYAEGDRRKMRELQPEMDRLTKIAAQGK